MEFVEKEEDLSGEEQQFPNPLISAETIPDFSRLERVLATMMGKVDHLSSELATLKGQQAAFCSKSDCSHSKTPTGLTDYLDRQGLISLRIATEKKRNVSQHVGCVCISPNI